MKSKKKWTAIATTALALILAAAFSVQAGPHGRGKGGGCGFGPRGGGEFGPPVGMEFGPHHKGMKPRMGGLGCIVDLTEVQKDAMGAIRDGYRDQMTTLRDKMRASREDTRVLVEAGDHEGAFEAGSAVRKEMFVLRGKMKSEMDAILTDEQRATLKEKRSQRHKRMERRHRDRVDNPEG